MENIIEKLKQIHDNSKKIFDTWTLEEKNNY
jgi:hypothetical protein